MPTIMNDDVLKSTEKWPKSGKRKRKKEAATRSVGVDVKMQDVKQTKRKTKSVPQTNPPDNVQEKERKKKTESHPS